MPKIEYIAKNFQAASQEAIEHVENVLIDYAAQGFKLTVRQIYYQFVAHDWFPEDRRWRWTGTRWVRDPEGTKNAQPNYTWLGGIINDARMAGLLDWGMIVDRTRKLRKNSHWDSPAAIVQACADQYEIDKWQEQDYRPEVWIEKDALVGVIEGLCEHLDVPYFSCRGYTSQSAMWGASCRLLNYIDDGKLPIIFHLGDHDPSGIDMTRDIRERLCTFGCDLEVQRLALLMEQIEEHDPPPSPAKITDSRAQGYIAEFGSDSWELDALEPATMVSLIEDAVVNIRDESRWQESVARENEHKQRLEDVVAQLEDE